MANEAEFTDICPMTDIPEGAREVFDVDGRWVAIFCVSGRYYAIEDLCTHDGGTLTEDRYGNAVPLEGHEIECPRHGGRFDIRDGRATKAPALQAVPWYEVRVVDGMIQVRI